MKRTTFYLLAALFLLGWSGHDAHAAKSIEVSGLKCEYFKNPVGLGESSPRLSWILTSSKTDQYQTACQVLVATTEAGLSEKSADMWNSGKMETDQSIQVVYEGKALESRGKYWWKVRVWDRDGKASRW